MQHALSMRPALIAFPLLTVLISCASAAPQDAPRIEVQDTPLTETQDIPLTEPPTAPATEVPTTVTQEVGPMLPNGDFSLPRVPDEAKFLPKGHAPGWAFDIKGGDPGIAVEYWKKERTPFFYWNNPNGSISQTVNAARFARPKEGEALQLSYFYGGLGQGKCTLVAAILVDGKPVTSATHDLELKTGGPQTPGMLPYTIKKEDVGKVLVFRSPGHRARIKGSSCKVAQKRRVLAVSPPQTAK